MELDYPILSVLVLGKYLPEDDNYIYNHQESLASYDNEENKQSMISFCCPLPGFPSNRINRLKMVVSQGGKVFVSPA